MIELEPVVQLDLTLSVINIRLSLSGAYFGTGDLDFERRIKTSAGVDSIKTFRTFYIKSTTEGYNSTLDLWSWLRLKNGAASLCYLPLI